LTAPQAFEAPAGMFCITTTGSVIDSTMQSYSDLRSFNDRNGLVNIVYQPIRATLVDKARNDAVRTMLANANLQYLIFLDGDMEWRPELVMQMLQTAYQQVPHADIVGGWCPLRGEPYLPTIDTGTGTWESTLPGQGPIEVIRTGGACLLIKRHVLEKMQAPWFGVRNSPRSLDTLLEFDNFARIKFDGRNPFTKLPEWAQLEGCAADEATRYRQAHPVDTAGSQFSSVGEDSNFADKCRALGFRIFVQTNVVCGHVDRKVIQPSDHIDAMKKLRRQENLACGILE
jgi:hypothetical protein